MEGTYSKNANLSSDFLAGSFAQNGHTGIEVGVWAGVAGASRHVSLKCS